MASFARPLRGPSGNYGLPCLATHWRRRRIRLIATGRMIRAGAAKQLPDVSQGQTAGLLAGGLNSDQQRNQCQMSLLV